MSVPFAHLHVASGFSLRYGASNPTALVQQAVAHGQQLLALTDRDGLYGAVRFAIACRDAGIRPVLGVDIAVTPSGLLPTKNTPISTRRTPARGGVTLPQPTQRVVLLARNQQGWASLCRLVSAAHLRGERGETIVSEELIAQHHAGLLLLLGADSECGQAVASRRPDLAGVGLRRWQNIFGSDIRVSVACHFAPTGSTDRTRSLGLSLPVAARSYRWAMENQVPAVLTNAVRHATREQAPTVDILDAIRRLVPMSGRHLDRGNAEGYLKSGLAMRSVARQIITAAGYNDGSSRADQWLHQTVSDAEQCAIDPAADLGIGSVHVPELSVITASDLPASAAEQAVRADELLRSRCEQRLLVRYPGKQQRGAQQRLDDELRTIATMGFGGYFLTVAEVVDLIRDMGVRAAARGSGAGSLVNHLLGISGVDPLQHDLLMERFLSPLRKSLPDIDVDVESARRTEVYERILARFGGQRCICVSMMDTYRVRHAVRDVGAALGMPLSEIDAFAKSFPHIAAREARAALQELPELRRSGLGQLAATGRLDRFLDLVQSLDGLPRHVAVHPCGVLLSDATLLDRTPVESSWLGFPMSQFDKDDVEHMGFLKLDVLGIRMQSAMAHAIDEIARTEDVSVEIDQVAFDDPETFDLIRSSRTLGCFQIESPGQRELIGKFAPETFEDIVIDISLFRPGPVKSDMITPFLRARHGWQLPTYLHEDLRPVLEKTAGVVVFHEQVIRIVAVMTGCTLAYADEVRRTLGTPAGQQQVRTWFYPTAIAAGYTVEVVEQVWDILAAFASFGFCKAHAAAFALPTYQSAWLKTHHPAAFLAGVLTHDPGMYPKRLILDDARNFGIPILGLDVNRSDRTYRVEPVDDGHTTKWGIRLAVAEVKGISAAETAAVVAGQPYESLADFWHRSAVSRPTAERIVMAGGLDDIHNIGTNSGFGAVTRRDLLLQIIDLERYSRSLRRNLKGKGKQQRIEVRHTAVQTTGNDPVVAARRQSQAPAVVHRMHSAQLSLDLADAPNRIVASGLPEMTASELVRAQVEVLGMDVSAHVVSFYEQMLREVGTIRSRDLLQHRGNEEVLVAGVKVATQTPPVRSGRRVVFLTLDDSSGPIDATFFEDAQVPFAATLFQSWLLLVRGRLRRTGPRGVSVRATGCWDLGQIRQLWQAGGAAKVYDLLRAAPEPAASSKSAAPQSRRVLVHSSGFKLSPYADIKPAGADIKSGSPAKDSPANEPPAKLWHSSPGSSGW